MKSMVQIHQRPREIPVAEKPPANPLRARGTATHLTGVKRIDRNPLDFSDLRDAADYVPEWARQLTIDEQIADILATASAAPAVRHEPEFLARLAPIADALFRSLPATDWRGWADTVRAAANVRLMQLPVAAWCRDLDDWYNAAVVDLYAVSREVIFPAQELQDELISDMADSIAAEVTL